MKLRSFGLVRNASSVGGGRSEVTFPKPVDAWVAVWERGGIEVPGWAAEATLVVRAVIENETEKVLNIEVVLFDPNASLAPPGDQPATESCAPISGWSGHAEFCYHTLE